MVELNKIAMAVFHYIQNAMFLDSPCPVKPNARLLIQSISTIKPVESFHSNQSVLMISFNYIVPSVIYWNYGSYTCIYDTDAVCISILAKLLWLMK